MTTSLIEFTRKRSTLALVAVTALGALLRLLFIGQKTLWLDEAFSIWIAQQGMVEGWRWLLKIDQHPPLYYSSLAVWQALLGDGQGVVRAFSALCSTLAIPFLFGAVRRITRDQLTALFAALILAISPFHVRFAQEARMYALLTVLVAVALYCAALYLGGYGTRRLAWRDFVLPRRWWRLHDVRAAVGLAAAQAGVMWTHNTATVFFPLALNLAVLGVWLVQRLTGRYVSIRAVNSDRFVGNWLKLQAVAFLLWLPWAIPFVIQARKVDQEFWIWAPTWTSVLGTFKTFSFAHLPDWVPVWPGLLFYVVLVLLGVYFLRRQLAWAGLLLALFLVPIGGELLVSLRRPIFYDRTLIWTTLPYFALMAAGIRGIMVGVFARDRERLFPEADAMAGNRPLKLARRGLAGLALLVIVGLSGLSLWFYYLHYDKEEWDTAAAYVAAEAEPSDMILFNATWVQIPFDYYFRHYDVDAELHGAPVDLFDRGVLEPKMTPDDLPALRELVADAPRVWLVYSHDWYTDPQQLVPGELNRLMHQVERRQFVGLQVLRFER